MAKQRGKENARGTKKGTTKGNSSPKQSRNDRDDMLLIRSAEALGRVIGSLQRQLRDARRSLTRSSPDARGRGRTSHSRKKK